MDFSTFCRVALFAAAIFSTGFCEVQKVKNTPIKIVTAPALSRIPAMPSPKVLTLRVKPSNISGPSHLQQLAGECFKFTQKGYTYKVCPFKNVTQKEERAGWSSYHGVLGVWREWIIENDTFIGMHFEKGDMCSVGDREVKVLFNCSAVTRLRNATEPTTCHYIIRMDTPLACFKGAMQVYHLLTAQQLSEWDQLDYEYHADELTYQGLTKMRRKILTQAGLLIDRVAEKKEQEEERKRKEEQQALERKLREETIFGGVHSPIKSQLTACEKERDTAQKALKELTEKVWQVVKGSPAIAFKLGFIQNDSHANTSLTVARGNKEGTTEEVVVGGGHQLEQVVPHMELLATEGNGKEREEGGKEGEEGRKEGEKEGGKEMDREGEKEGEKVGEKEGRTETEEGEKEEGKIKEEEEGRLNDDGKEETEKEQETRGQEGEKREKDDVTKKVEEDDAIVDELIMQVNRELNERQRVAIQPKEPAINNRGNENGRNVKEELDQLLDEM